MLIWALRTSLLNHIHLVFAKDELQHSEASAGWVKSIINYNDMAMRTKKEAGSSSQHFYTQMKKMVLKANELCSTLTENPPQNARI